MGKIRDSVPVAVVDVVDMGVAMNRSLVTMPVRMRYLRELLGRVLVLMMLVVRVRVRVLQSLMHVQVLVPIRCE